MEVTDEDARAGVSTSPWGDLDDGRVCGAMIAAADAGDSLGVRGLCQGPNIDKDLTILGSPSTAAPQATLDGGGYGTVLNVWDGKVSLSKLTIQNGEGDNWNDIEIRAATSITAAR